MPKFVRTVSIVCWLIAAAGPACAPTAPKEEAAGPPSAAPAAAPTIPEDRPLRVGFLIVDGVYNTELTAPYDLFHHTPFHTQPGMQVFTVAPGGGEVRTFEGLRLIPDYALDNAPPIDILVVPSAEGSMDRDLEDTAMLDWVREVGGRARYVISLCDGAFVLAAAGLLDGHQCTTFPGDQDRFAEMFPELDLQRGYSFVHDGRVLTSEGGARSFDVALYLIDLLYGPKVARGVGRGLILPWPPEPGTVPRLVTPR